MQSICVGSQNKPDRFYIWLAGPTHPPRPLRNTHTHTFFLVFKQQLFPSHICGDTFKPLGAVNHSENIKQDVPLLIILLCPPMIGSSHGHMLSEQAFLYMHTICCLMYGRMHDGALYLHTEQKEEPIMAQWSPHYPELIKGTVICAAVWVYLSFSVVSFSLFHVLSKLNNNV